MHGVDLRRLIQPERERHLARRESLRSHERPVVVEDVEVPASRPVFEAQSSDLGDAITVEVSRLTERRLRHLAKEPHIVGRDHALPLREINWEGLAGVDSAARAATCTATTCVAPHPLQNPSSTTSIARRIITAPRS